jgi:hypothetical protein
MPPKRKLHSVCNMHSSSPPHSCYMPCPSHHPWLHSNYTWRRVQVMELLII